MATRKAPPKRPNPFAKGGLRPFEKADRTSERKESPVVKKSEGLEPPKRKGKK